MSESVRVCIVSASGQNVFFAEILEAFGEALREQGVTVEESVDCFPPPAPDLVYMFVPHEYNPLVDELAHPSALQLRRSVVVCTEQPGTHWFEVCSQLAAQAGAVVDINALGVEELRRRGVDAAYAPLCYVPAWDRWRRRKRERTVDLAFLGGYTERRAGILARCAPVLRDRRSAIHLTESTTPHVEGSSYFLARERKWKLMANSKVILNVHRDELPYLEWHRAIGAMLNGCVLLSEHSIGSEPLVPGEHFAPARYDDLPRVLEALLDDGERLTALRESAYELVRERFPAAGTAASLLSAMERAAAFEVPSDGASSPAPSPMPCPLPPPPPAWETHSGHLDQSSLAVRMALKHLVVQVRGLERRVEGLTASGEVGGDAIEHLGPIVDSPRVSVLLTVHNYADHVGQALRSVALSDMQELEVVAVDDASTDDSVGAVRRATEELPWLPITFIRRGRNHGLPAARNLALQHARADLVFVLDADNAVLPRGIGTLAGALEEHPEAAFSYGVIECFDTDGPSGLMNWLAWDPVRLRQGNYVDAMAMIRRSALEAVGGYATDPALFGWEDFALWIAMACTDMQGIRVPDFVARYRRAAHSMLSLTSIDITAAWAALLRRYPALVEWGAPTVVESGHAAAANVAAAAAGGPTAAAAP